MNATDRFCIACRYSVKVFEIPPQGTGAENYLCTHPDFETFNQVTGSKMPSPDCLRLRHDEDANRCGFRGALWEAIE